MNDWKNLHSDFENPELVKKWTDKGFTYQQIESWIGILGDKFDSNDYDLFYQTIDQAIKKLKEEKEIKEQPKSEEITKFWSSEEVDLTDNIPTKKSKLVGEVEKLRNVYCDQCSKYISIKLAYFSDREKNLDFCSEDCHSEWAKMMALYKSIHPNFTPELRKEWEEKGFKYNEVKEWAKSLKDSFGVNDYYFCTWLRDIKQLAPKTLDYGNIGRLVDEFTLGVWQKNIHPDFTSELKKKWDGNKFSYDEVKKLINIGGYIPNDAEFCAWLRDEANLREQFKEYLKEKNKKLTLKLIQQLRNKRFYWRVSQCWFKIRGGWFYLLVKKY